MERKMIFITGVAGFIGVNLAEYFLKQGHAVYGIDNFSSGQEENIDYLFSLDCDGVFGFDKLDIAKKVPKLNFPPQVVIHAASLASPEAYYNLPLETVKVNTTGTINVASIVAESGVNTTALLLSTSEIYGDEPCPQNIAQFGNVNPVGERACYSESKRCAETVWSLLKAQGYNAKIVRLFNTYGPRMKKDDGRVMTNFVAAAIADNPLVIYGDGKATRSFCYISDIVNGLDKYINTPEDFHWLINLGGDTEITIKELAEFVIKIVGSKSKIEYKPARLDEPPLRRPDISCAVDELKWEPKINLKTGLINLIINMGGNYVRQYHVSRTAK